MVVTELCRDHIIELKQSYLTQLEECGELQEVAGHDKVFMSDLANADDLVPDDVIFEHYEGMEFSKDDFSTRDVDDLFPDLNIDIKEVACDNYGDNYWNYLVTWYSGDDEIWSDYFHIKPDDTKLHNVLQEAYDDGDLYPKEKKA